LVRDLERALRSEFGAYSAYSLLPRLVRNRELKGLLGVLRDDEQDLIERARTLIEELGGKAPKSRWTRSVAAWALFFVTPIVGLRFALRLCREAETTVSRWYGEHAVQLFLLGDQPRAERARQMSAIKWRHAVRLGAFVDHLRRGDG
jgi:rubrerythrin